MEILQAIVFVILVSGIILVVWWTLYSYNHTYEIVKKISIPTGTDTEYYFFIRKLRGRKSCQILVSKEIYDFHEVYDIIVIHN